MKAAVMEQPFELAIKELPIPVPGPDEVLIQVAACGICGSDVHGYEGKHFQFTYPRVMGHEFGGVVVQVGSQVTQVRVGDRVCAETNQPCGQCYLCQHGMAGLCQNRKTNGFDIDGGLAEYVAIPAVNTVPVPDDMDLDTAVLTQPFGVSYHALHDRVNLRQNDLVVILGAGGVGLGAQVVAKCMGARTLVTDLSDYRLETARKMGADFTVNTGKEDLAAVVREITGGIGADLVLECVGGNQCKTLEQAVNIVKFRGTVITMGTFSSSEVIMNPNLIRWHEINFCGSQGQYGAYAPVLNLIYQHKPDLSLMHTHTFPLSRTQEAFDLLRHQRPEDHVIKILIKP